MSLKSNLLLEASASYQDIEKSKSQQNDYILSEISKIKSQINSNGQVFASSKSGRITKKQFIISAVLICSVALNCYFMFSSPAISPITPLAMFQGNQINETRDTIQDYIRLLNYTFQQEQSERERVVEDFLSKVQFGVNEAASKIEKKHQHIIDQVNKLRNMTVDEAHDLIVSKVQAKIQQEREEERLENFELTALLNWTTGGDIDLFQNSSNYEYVSKNYDYTRAPGGEILTFPRPFPDNSTFILYTHAYDSTAQAGQSVTVFGINSDYTVYFNPIDVNLGQYYWVAGCIDSSMNFIEVNRLSDFQPSVTDYCNL